MTAGRKPTRSECFREAAPYLARLVLDGRRRRAEAASSPDQSSDGTKACPPATPSPSDRRPTAA